MTPYEIHEAIVAHIAEHSNRMAPSNVFVAIGGLPAAWYCQNADGLWVRDEDQRMPTKR